MVSKKELKLEIDKKDSIISELGSKLFAKNNMIEDQKRKIEGYDRMFAINNLGVMTVNLSAYPTKEAKDEVLGHVRERMDDEMLRLNMANDLDWITLPDEVTSVIVVQH